VASIEGISQDLLEFLRERLQVVVEPFSPGERVALAAEEARGLASCLVVPVGLLAETTPALTINLLPWKLREHKKHLAGNLLLVVGTLVYVLTMVVGYWGLRWAKDNYQRTVFNLQQGLAQVLPMVKARNKVEELRRQRDYEVSVLKRFRRRSPLWRGVFFELSWLVPKELMFSSMQVTGTEGHWQVEAEGIVVAETSFAAQQVLQRFIQRLEGSVFFRHPEVLKVNIVPHKGSLEDVASGQAELRFVLRCYLGY